MDTKTYDVYIITHQKGNENFDIVDEVSENCGTDMDRALEKAKSITLGQFDNIRVHAHKYYEGIYSDGYVKKSMDPLPHETLYESGVQLYI